MYEAQMWIYRACFFRQQHFVFHWCRSRFFFWRGGGWKCKGVNGSDSCFLLSCLVLLRQNPGNMAVSVLSGAQPICFAPKTHSDDWNLTWHCLLDTVNFCYFLFLYNIHYWINLFYRQPFVTLFLAYFKGNLLLWIFQASNIMTLIFTAKLLWNFSLPYSPCSLNY